MATHLTLEQQKRIKTEIENCYSDAKSINAKQAGLRIDPNTLIKGRLLLLTQQFIAEAKRKSQPFSAKKLQGEIVNHAAECVADCEGVSGSERLNMMAEFCMAHTNVDTSSYDAPVSSSQKKQNAPVSSSQKKQNAPVSSSQKKQSPVQPAPASSAKLSHSAPTAESKPIHFASTVTTKLSSSDPTTVPAPKRASSKAKTSSPSKGKTSEQRREEVKAKQKHAQVEEKKVQRQSPFPAEPKEEGWLDWSLRKVGEVRDTVVETFSEVSEQIVPAPKDPFEAAKERYLEALKILEDDKHTGVRETAGHTANKKASDLNDSDFSSAGQQAQARRGYWQTFKSAS